MAWLHTAKHLFTGVTELLGQRDEEVTLGFRCWHEAFWASQVALVVKNLPANEET